MKSFLIAVVVLVLGDLAINHGAGSDSIVRAVLGFFDWLAHVGDGSVFTE